MKRTKSWSYRHPAYPGLLWKEIEPVTSDHPAASVTRYDYHATGMVSRKTDGMGRTTRYGYDVFNRLTAVRQPMNATTRFGYDGHGNLRVLVETVTVKM